MRPCVMPLALARSAIALPTAFAAVDVARALEAFATSSCTVDAAATTVRLRVEDLRVDVLRRAVHRQAHHVQLPDLGAAAAGARRRLSFFSMACTLTSSSFP